MKKKMFHWNRNRLFSVLLTSCIVMLLVMAGPASALSFIATPIVQTAALGNPVSVDIVMKTDADKIPVDNIEISCSELASSATATCSFRPNGQLITCDSSVFTVQNLLKSGAGYTTYGYGNNGSGTYGYGYGGYGYYASDRQAAQASLLHRVSIVFGIAGTWSCSYLYNDGNTNLGFSSNTFTVTANSGGGGGSGGGGSGGSGGSSSSGSSSSSSGSFDVSDPQTESLTKFVEKLAGAIAGVVGVDAEKIATQFAKELGIASIASQNSEDAAQDFVRNENPAEVVETSAAPAPQKSLAEILESSERVKEFFDFFEKEVQESSGGGKSPLSVDGEVISLPTSSSNQEFVKSLAGFVSAVTGSSDKEPSTEKVVGKNVQDVPVTVNQLTVGANSKVTQVSTELPIGKGPTDGKTAVEQFEQFFVKDQDTKEAKELKTLEALKNDKQDAVKTLAVESPVAKLADKDFAQGGLFEARIDDKDGSPDAIFFDIPEQIKNRDGLQEALIDIAIGFEVNFVEENKEFKQIREQVVQQIQAPEVEEVALVVEEFDQKARELLQARFDEVLEVANEKLDMLKKSDTELQADTDQYVAKLEKRRVSVEKLIAEINTAMLGEDISSSLFARLKEFKLRLTSELDSIDEKIALTKEERDSVGEFAQETSLYIKKKIKDVTVEVNKVLKLSASEMNELRIQDYDKAMREIDELSKIISRESVFEMASASIQSWLSEPVALMVVDLDGVVEGNRLKLPGSDGGSGFVSTFDTTVLSFNPKVLIEIPRYAVEETGASVNFFVKGHVASQIKETGLPRSLIQKVAVEAAPVVEEEKKPIFFGLGEKIPVAWWALAMALVAVGIGVYLIHGIARTRSAKKEEEEEHDEEEYEEVEEDFEEEDEDDTSRR